LLAFFGVDASLFRSAWYLQFLEPGSSAGSVEEYLYWLRQQPPGAVPEVVVVGDSRIAEGFAARQANARLDDRVKFWNFGIPGTSPRDWYYILRDADPSRRRFAAIVLAIDHYADDDSFSSPEDSFVDLNFVIGRLKLSDCWSFAMSMKKWEYRTGAMSGCLFKGLTLRRDVRALLVDRAERLARIADWRLNGLGYVSGYGGSAETLRGLSVDWSHRTIQFPPGAKPWQKESVQSVVTGLPPPQTGDMTRYRERWLGGILNLYKASPTRIILVQVPRGPAPNPRQRAPAQFIRTIAGRPRVKTIPSEMFHDLERPDVFADGVHLNAEGRVLFSDRLTDQVATILAND